MLTQSVNSLEPSAHHLCIGLTDTLSETLMFMRMSVPVPVLVLACLPACLRAWVLVPGYACACVRVRVRVCVSVCVCVIVCVRVCV